VKAVVRGYLFKVCSLFYSRLFKVELILFELGDLFEIDLGIREPNNGL